MGDKRTTLGDAIRLVDGEQSYLEAERAAFVKFREDVSHIRSDSHRTNGASAAKQVRTAFTSHIMDDLGYEETYSASIDESLKHEFSPSVAETLIRKDQFLQRHKRNLLISVNEAIGRRDEFIKVLNSEASALDSFANELSDMAATLTDLPMCSLQHQTFDTYLQTNCRYDSLVETCEDLLDRRQAQLSNPQRSNYSSDGPYALNRYLYSDLETTFPVLAAIGDVLAKIETNRTSKSKPQSSIQY